MKSKARKKNLQVPEEGIVHIKASFNNNIITVTNLLGEVLAWSSAGKRGFKGPKKSTPLAAQIATKDCAKKVYEQGMRKVAVIIKGIGGGREAAARAVSEAGLLITKICDATPLPHNGCRPPKARTP